MAIGQMRKGNFLDFWETAFSNLDCVKVAGGAQAARRNSGAERDLAVFITSGLDQTMPTRLSPMKPTSALTSRNEPAQRQGILVLVCAHGSAHHMKWCFSLHTQSHSPSTRPRFAGLDLFTFFPFFSCASATLLLPTAALAEAALRGTLSLQ